MSDLAFIVAGRLNELTGGHLFDGRIVDGLRARGRTVRVVELGPGDADELAALPAGIPTAFDAVALPTLAPLFDSIAARLRLIAFVHHPLSDEPGIAATEQRRLADLERALLPRCRGVLCPSKRTAAALAALGVPAERIAVTPPGTAKPDRPIPPRDRPVRRLLYVANLIPRKGHAVLVEALAQLRDLDWKLHCVGSLDRDPETVRDLRAQIAELGLDARITLAGELASAAVAPLYAAADAFVSASLHEGYGMACAEAVAWHLPQVSTATGAIPEIVAPDAGLLVQPGDVGGLAAALRALIADPALARRLAAGAQSAARRLIDWPEAVSRWESAFDHLATSA